MATLEEIQAAIQAATQVFEARIAAQFEALQTQIGTIQTQVQQQMDILETQVIALQDRIPAQSSGNQEPQSPPPDRHLLSPILEGIEEEVPDEANSDAEEDDRSSYRTTVEPTPLQQMLEQFEKARRQERRLRKQEISELVAAIKAPSASSSSTAVQPLVRNSPNFTKYDGKCDHAVVTQFIHQFVTHFPLAKLTDPQDKVHLAAPHLTGEAVPWWQRWSKLHTNPATKLPQYDWDTFVSDFKQRFLPPQFLTDLEDEFAILAQKGMPVLTYSNKLLTITQQIGTPEKDKLRAFIRGLDSSIKYSVRNLDPKTYEEALVLAQNKELELNGGKPKQAASGSSTAQAGGKAQADKGKNGKANGKPKQTPDEKAKAGVLGGFLTEDERKAYMKEQRCFFCHTKGHRKQDCTKWKAKNPTATASTSAASTTASDTPAPTPPALATSAVFHHVPSLHAPNVHFVDKQKGAPKPSGLLRALGTAQGHKFTVLFDTGSSEDLISPQLATKLQCSFTPVQVDVDGFTPGIRTQITQKAENVQFQIQHVTFERDFLVSRLVGCDLLLGNPWLDFHLPIIDTRTGTFFLTEGVPTPTSITCD